MGVDHRCHQCEEAILEREAQLAAMFITFQLFVKWQLNSWGGEWGYFRLSLQYQCSQMIHTNDTYQCLSASKQENFVVDLVSNSATSLWASSIEVTYKKLSVSSVKIPAMLFLFVSQESWDWHLQLFGCRLSDFRESSEYSILSPSRPRWLTFLKRAKTPGLKSIPGPLSVV